VEHGTTPRRLDAADDVKPGVSSRHRRTAAEVRHVINVIADAATNPTQRRTSSRNVPLACPSVETPTVRTDGPNGAHRPS
jgi:hypothetical protein